MTPTPPASPPVAFPPCLPSSPLVSPSLMTRRNQVTSPIRIPSPAHSTCYLPSQHHPSNPPAPALNTHMASQNSTSWSMLQRSNRANENPQIYSCTSEVSNNHYCNLANEANLNARQIEHLPGNYQQIESYRLPQPKEENSLVFSTHFSNAQTQTEALPFTDTFEDNFLAESFCSSPYRRAVVDTTCWGEDDSFVNVNNIKTQRRVGLPVNELSHSPFATELQCSFKKSTDVGTTFQEYSMRKVPDTINFNEQNIKTKNRGETQIKKRTWGSLQKSARNTKLNRKILEFQSSCGSETAERSEVLRVDSTPSSSRPPMPLFSGNRSAVLIAPNNNKDSSTTLTCPSVSTTQSDSRFYRSWTNSFTGEMCSSFPFQNPTEVSNKMLLHYLLPRSYFSTKNTLSSSEVNKEDLSSTDVNVTKPNQCTDTSKSSGGLSPPSATVGSLNLDSKLFTQNSDIPVQLSFGGTSSIDMNGSSSNSATHYAETQGLEQEHTFVNADDTNTNGLVKSRSMVQVSSSPDFSCNVFPESRLNQLSFGNTPLNLTLSSNKNVHRSIASTTNESVIAPLTLFGLIEQSNESILNSPSCMKGSLSEQIIPICVPGIRSSSSLSTLPIHSPWQHLSTPSGGNTHVNGVTPTTSLNSTRLKDPPSYRPHGRDDLFNSSSSLSSSTLPLSECPTRPEMESPYSVSSYPSHTDLSLKGGVRSTVMSHVMQHLFRDLLLLWCRQTQAVRSLNQQDTESDKTVLVSRASGEFGFRIHGSRPVVVSAIEADTPAETSGLEVGDIVLSINGVSVLEASHSEVVKLAHSGGCDTLRLEVARTGNLLAPLLTTDPTPVCAGYLYKLGTAHRAPGSSAITRRWHRRWFALTKDHSLYHYRTEVDPHPLGCVVLRGHTVHAFSTATRPYAFTVAVAGTTGLQLAAHTAEARGRWGHVISQAAEQAAQRDELLEASARRVQQAPGTIAAPDCFGHLQKLGARWHQWKKRYCVLKDACLYLYHDTDATQAIGVVHLHGYRVQSTSIGGKKNAFELLPPEPKLRHFYFHSDSDNDKKRWLAALEYSIDRWIKAG